MQKIIILIVVAWGFFVPLHAYSSMSSSNYSIYADSINTGGILSTGGSYSLQDTFGESTAVGTSTINLYEVRSGYMYMEQSYITLNITPTTIDLGDLSTSAISSDSSTVTITTDSSDGYTFSISSVSGTSLTAVSDGSVTAGSEEYGLVTSGSDGQLSADTAITSSLIVAYSNTVATDSATTLTFKASMSDASSAGTYSQTINFLAAAN